MTLRGMVQELNIRLRDIQKIFGIESDEYQSFKKLVTSKTNNLYIEVMKDGEKTGAIKLPQTNVALGAYNEQDIKKLLYKKRNTNLSSMAYKYTKNSKMTRKELLRSAAWIKESAEYEHRLKTFSDKWYQIGETMEELEELDKHLTETDRGIIASIIRDGNNGNDAYRAKRYQDAYEFAWSEVEKKGGHRPNKQDDAYRGFRV